MTAARSYDNHLILHTLSRSLHFSEVKTFYTNFNSRRFDIFIKKVLIKLLIVPSAAFLILDLSCAVTSETGHATGIQNSGHPIGYFMHAIILGVGHAIILGVAERILCDISKTETNFRPKIMVFSKKKRS